MSNPGPTKEEYDSLIYQLATLESELRKARKLLEAPSKTLWWKRLWGAPSVVALVVAFLLLPTVSLALTDYQEALRGLKGVSVLVERMNPEAERLGLTTDQIKTDVELRLRQARVRVLTTKEALETPGDPILYVNVNTILGSYFLAYSISVQFRERVTLARGFKTQGAIWDRGMVGSVGTEKITEVRRGVKELVDMFINDFLAANPR